MNHFVRMLVILAALHGHAFAGNRPLLHQPPEMDQNRGNPYDSQPGAARAGRKLFRRECSMCHGEQAQGTRFAPALASVTMRQATAGAIFWVLRNGALRHGMPSFAHLPEPQRWQIVTYLKSLQP